jgi:hypothetical protein
MAFKTDAVHPDALELARLLRPVWGEISSAIPTWHPRNEGEEDGDSESEAAKAAADAEAARIAAEADKGGEEGGEEKPKETDWKAMARKHEREAKKARDEAAAHRKKLDEIEAANLSDQEKAIAKAREEATSEVTTKYEAQQRTDRIENAVTKLSLRGFKAKDKDGNEVTLKFADPDDAQLRIDRALRNEDLSYDEIYAGGKVQTDALTAFLTELLEEHPRLRAEESNGSKKEPVDFDAGKGHGAGSKTLEEMTPDDHLKQIQGSR